MNTLIGSLFRIHVFFMFLACTEYETKFWLLQLKKTLAELEETKCSLESCLEENKKLNR